MSDAGREKFKNSTPVSAVEQNTLNKQDFDTDIKLTNENVAVYLELNLDKNWVTEQKRMIVTSGLLGRAIVPNLPFDNADGSPVNIDTDYLGKMRNTVNPSPGPFEISKSGKQKIKVW